MFGIFNLGPAEIVVLLVIGVLLFGRRLPEVGRYLGKGIVEFKKGVKGLEDEVDTGVAGRNEPSPEQIRAPQRVAASAPKFEEAPPAAGDLARRTFDSPASTGVTPNATPNLSTPPRA